MIRTAETITGDIFCLLFSLVVVQEEFSSAYFPRELNLGLVGAHFSSRLGLSASDEQFYYYYCVAHCTPEPWPPCP